MNSRSRKILLAALQTPVLDHVVQNEFSSNFRNLEYATLSPVPPSFPDSNEVFTQIMEQKSGPIFVDRESTSDESRDTTEWLPPNNNKSIISSSVFDDFNKPSCSRIVPNETDFSISNVVSDRIILENNTMVDSISLINESNINSEVEEALEVGTEALRLPRKTNIRELKKKRKSQRNSEEDREKLFTEFWSSGDPVRQKDYLLRCVKTIDIKRKRRVDGNSRRNISKEYSLTYKNERKIVCLQFILSTLNISKKFLYYTVNNASPDQILSKLDNRGKHVPTNKKSEDTLKAIDEFIQKLPAVKSHYCRASSSRKYLPTDIENVGRLYKMYTSYCTSKKFEIVSKTMFRKIFHTKYNIGFHSPKKDKCRFCLKYENITSARELTEEEQKLKTIHEEEKNAVKEMFLYDQNLSKAKGNFICISFDLQKVLNTPQGQNMNLYYSRKYSMFNLTVYESGTQNAIAYLWGETNGGRGCNEIVTCIYKYLLSLDEKQLYKSVALYCDSCCGQNKNRAMIAMLYNTKFKFIEKVKITFLLPGHTYMPVDSVHATIERFTRNKTVWAPSEWSTLIRNSRINPSPIEVRNVQYLEFYDWKTLAKQYFTLNLKTTDNEFLQITKVKSFIFNKPLNGDHNVKVFFTYSADEEPKTLKVKKKNIGINPLQLYAENLQITIEKQSDLLKLCTDDIIPHNFHEEYSCMKSNQNISDILQETDEEDSD
ncbi:Uncharacterized protein FWK35_00037535 [Aphis craccivora]|uniref:DUF7869 domain-containing protein n=1 Tax=Aphis craccivora TaxID=307492 RepID=A0A6G0VRG4_APHCR|nr:Uncharacterized protein FWK35_00037535 [Aphis craccivora]